MLCHITKETTGLQIRRAARCPCLAEYHTRVTAQAARLGWLPLQNRMGTLPAPRKRDHRKDKLPADTQPLWGLILWLDITSFFFPLADALTKPQTTMILSGQSSLSTLRVVSILFSTSPLPWCLCNFKPTRPPGLCLLGKKGLVCIRLTLFLSMYFIFGMPVKVIKDNGFEVMVFFK